MKKGPISELVAENNNYFSVTGFFFEQT